MSLKLGRREFKIDNLTSKKIFSSFRFVASIQHRYDSCHGIIVLKMEFKYFSRSKFFI